MIDVPQGAQATEQAPQGVSEQSDGNDVQKTLSEQINELSKMRQDFESERKSFESQRSEIMEMLGGDPQKFKEKLSKDPLSALSRFGLNQESLINQLLGDDDGGGGDPTLEVKKIADELKTNVQQYQQKVDSDLKKMQQEKVDQEIKQYKAQINQYINQKSDDFNILGAYRDEQSGNNPMVERAFEMIQKHYDETSKNGQGEVLPLDKVLKDLQDKTVDNFKSLFTRSAMIRNVAQELLKETAQSNGNQLPLQAPPVGEPRQRDTLTNDLSQSNQSAQKKMSRDESILKAAQLLRFTE